MAGVQGKHEIHPPVGPSISSTGAIYIAFVALVCFFCTSLLSTYLATSVGTRALTKTRLRVITGFFRSNWALQSTERLGHVQQLLGMNSSGTAGLVGNLSGGLQALLMVCALLGVALVINPIAAVAVLVMGFVLLQVLRPLNILTRRANRELSTVTKAMAMQTTEYTRLSRDFRLFGVETRVDKQAPRDDREHRSHRAAVQRGSAASRPSCTSPSHSESSSSGSSSCPTKGVQALEKDGIVLILVLRSVSYGVGRPGRDPGPPRHSGLAGGPDVRPQSLRRSSSHSRGPCARVLRGRLRFRGVLLRRGEPRPGRHHHAHPGGEDPRHARTLGQRQDDHQPDPAGPTRAHGGRATIGGEDAATISKNDAHNTVALVPQEPVLLQGSIMDNIKFFRDFEEEEVIEAAKSAHLHEDVDPDARRLRDSRGRGWRRPVGRAEAAPRHRTCADRLPRSSSSWTSRPARWTDAPRNSFARPSPSSEGASRS